MDVHYPRGYPFGRSIAWGSLPFHNLRGRIKEKGRVADPPFPFA
jgi:hypothetical protein